VRGAASVAFSERSNLTATTCLQTNACVCTFQMFCVSQMLLPMETKSLPMSTIQESSTTK